MLAVMLVSGSQLAHRDFTQAMHMHEGARSIEITPKTACTELTRVPVGGGTAERSIMHKTKNLSYMYVTACMVL